MALAQPSKLPAAQAARRAQMVSLHSDGDPAATAAAAEAAAVEAARVAADAAAAEAARLAAAAPENQPVTLTQAQLDQRLEESNRAAELARLEADELRAQLTEATRARNEQPREVIAPDLGFTDQDLAITPDEAETFGGSEAFVVKIVRREIAAAMKKYNVALDSRFVNVEQAAGSVGEVLAQTNQRRFMDQVVAKIPDVAKLVGHAKFKEFMRLPVPMTDIDYDEALKRAHKKENLQSVLDIFAAFRAKYGVASSSTAGYAGAPGSAANAEPAPATVGKRYTMTERKAKSQQLTKGQISKEEFATYKAEFDKALAEDRVDP